MVVKFLQTSRNSGILNMEIDEKMLGDAISGGYDFALVRFYEWEPKCISLGKNQRAGFENCGIDIVRRKTGGRALLHDKELTYSIAAPILESESVIQTYKRVSDCLIAGFARLGIELEYATGQYGSCGRLGNIASPAEVAMERFHTRPAHRGSCAPHTVNAYCMGISSGADIAYKGKKLIGSAQYRVKNSVQGWTKDSAAQAPACGYFLQHGSILFDADFDLIEKIFNQKVDRNKIATLNEINNEKNRKITKEELTEALKFGFEQGF